MSPPGATQQSCSAEPYGSRITPDPGALAAKVRIVNSVSNGSGYIRRREVDHWIASGRAVWIGPNDIRLIESHKANLTAKTESAKGYDEVEWSRLPFNPIRIPGLKWKATYKSKGNGSACSLPDAGRRYEPASR